MVDEAHHVYGCARRRAAVEAQVGVASRRLLLSDVSQAVARPTAVGFPAGLRAVELHSPNPNLTLILTLILPLTLPLPLTLARWSCARWCAAHAVSSQERWPLIRANQPLLLAPYP